MMQEEWQAKQQHDMMDLHLLGFRFKSLLEHQGVVFLEITFHNAFFCKVDIKPVYLYKQIRFIALIFLGSKISMSLCCHIYLQQ